MENKLKFSWIYKQSSRESIHNSSKEDIASFLDRVFCSPGKYDNFLPVSEYFCTFHGEVDTFSCVNKLKIPKFNW